MALVGAAVSDWILSFFKWEDMTGEYYAGKSKMELTLGSEIWKEFAGKTVLDFGCGDGAEAVEVAERGEATRVIGLDIDQTLLARARARAATAGVSDRVEFVDSFDGAADVVYALDSFEHFDDPAHILRLMSKLLRADGRCFVSFGPTWYHPWGAHTLIFPWSHLVLSESSVMKWRARFKNDGVERYTDGAGGVNKMTIARFIALIGASDFVFDRLELVPIRKLAPLHNRLTREFTTAVVRCTLRKR